MDPATLKRLIIDRELGELNADASALLDAYLAAGSQDSAVEHEIASTIGRVRSALAAPATPQPIALPPLRATRTPLLRVGGLQRLAAAAAIVLAFFAGTRSGSITTPEMRSTPRVAAGQFETGASGFWSLDRLRHTQTNRTHHSRKLNWASPITLPQTGEGS